MMYVTATVHMIRAHFAQTFKVWYNWFGEAFSYCFQY